MNKALDIAKYILTQRTLRNQSVNCVHLNYIMYSLQENYLRNYDKPLFTEEFQAWDKGCIIPEVYNVFCGYGGSKIPNTYQMPIKSLSITDIDFINVNLGLLDTPMWFLEDRIKDSNSPWSYIWDNGRGNII